MLPQLLWFRRVRRSLLSVFLISLFINLGMWFERFVIIVGSLRRDFLPSTWSDYVPTSVEIATLAGSFGLFFTCFLLFCRVLPVIAMAEVKGVLGHGHAGPGGVAMTRKVYVAGFTQEADLLRVVVAARRQHWPVLEAYTPYAVHGLDKAMGLQRSQLGKACFAFGLLGVLVALGFQFWSTAIDWPLNVGGQPWNSLPAFLPVTFETMVLFAGLGLVLTLFLRGRLYPGKQSWSPGLRETNDRFVLVFGEQAGPASDKAELQQLLEDCGVSSVETRELAIGER
jgi:molybdopterin-containing oxidoreductase family membrane subunit